MWPTLHKASHIDGLIGPSPPEVEISIVPILLGTKLEFRGIGILVSLTPGPEVLQSPDGKARSVSVSAPQGPLSPPFVPSSLLHLFI